MHRIRITVSYDGTDFHGWQVQPGLPTVQRALEDVLTNLEGRAVAVDGSGRTDAGVHALGQVAAFTLANPIPCSNLRRAMNRYLPPSIRVLSADEAAPSFHPRFDAVAKAYEYRMFRDEILDPFRFRYVHHHPYPLDEHSMSETAALFEGEHDFTAFAAADESDGEGRSKVRRIFHSRIERSEQLLVFRVQGSGFLKHMVRNMAGFLIETGRGNAGPETLRHLLQSGRRLQVGATAPAKGLFLVSVKYSDTL